MYNYELQCTCWYIKNMYNDESYMYIVRIIRKRNVHCRIVSACSVHCVTVHAETRRICTLYN